MDRITKQLVSDFLKNHGIKEKDDAKNFETFVNFCIISKEHNRTFDPLDFTIGSGNDTGIDGLAIIVNGYLISDESEVEGLLSQNGYLDVSYIFIQSKTSPSFQSKEINNFLFGVKDFFSETPGLIRNNDITKLADISNTILGHAAHFKKNPTCKMYYVTTGNWSEDPNHIAVIDSSKLSLESQNLFDNVEFHAVGSNEISKLYRNTQSPTRVEFIFSEKITLPETTDIDEAYYGILPLTEFRKILVDENNNIRSIFDDNVRDFQGLDNPINKKISQTLSGSNPDQFVALNNGVTIVARELKTTGTKFIIEDFQIVNGCQTSNILYQHIINKNENANNIFIPIRLIVTNNDETKSQITLATNRQTAIKTEQLAVLSEFQRNLELYYSTFKDDLRLYYERRAKQYSRDKDVTKNRIITVANQIKSFSAMFYQNPHLVSSFFGSIAKRTEKTDSDIFNKHHAYSPYYMSGLTFYKLESLFRSGAIDPKYKKIKFHILMLFRLVTEKSNPPPLTDKKKIDNYCSEIYTTLNDQQRCENAFNTCIDIVNNSSLDITDKLHYKQSSMVDDLIKTHNDYYRSL